MLITGVAFGIYYSRELPVSFVTYHHYHLSPFSLKWHIKKKISLPGVA
jgi:hypothetical protein